MNIQTDAAQPELLSFLVAAIDTTSHTIAWTLYLLAMNPIYQKRIRQEIMASRAMMDRNKQNEDIWFGESSKLKWLEACINESLRLKPVAAGGPQRTLSQDIKIDNYTLKKGQWIAIAVQAIHLDGDIYENPENFYPERFMNTSYVSSLKKEKQFLPFSFGKRDCVGQSLALLELKIILGKIIEVMDIESCNEPDEFMDLTLHSFNGISIKFNHAEEHDYVYLEREI